MAFKRTQYLAVTRLLNDLLLSGLVDASPSPTFDITSIVHLYQSGPAPNFNSVLTDYTLCDFHGYAGVVVASVLGPINLPTGDGVHKEVDFLCTSGGPTTPQSALGILIVDTTGMILFAGEQFAAPVAIANPGDGVSYDLILAPKISWGGEQGA